MSVNPDTLKQIVEAAIMAAEAPVTVPQLMGLFPDDARPERERINEVIDTLEAECAERGVALRKIGAGYRYQTREHLAPWLRKLNEGRPPRYSRALLETLAIIAYQQPVSRGDIEDIRGVAVSTEIMRTLQERDWIKQVGVRDVPGHPALYGTTADFLAYFDLQSLKELPVLIEQRDLKAIAREQNIDLPVEEHEAPAQGDAGETDDDDDAADLSADAEAGMDDVEDDEAHLVELESAGGPEGVDVDPVTDDPQADVDDAAVEHRQDDHPAEPPPPSEDAPDEDNPRIPDDTANDDDPEAGEHTSGAGA